MRVGYECKDCPHPVGQCRLVQAVDIQPNSFNVVQDKDEPRVCHVLQFEPDYKEKYESIVSSIKELIKGYSKERYSLANNVIEDLQKLIESAIVNNYKRENESITKHFNQDRESLVLSIKELIDNRSFLNFGTVSAVIEVDALQKLIEGE